MRDAYFTRRHTGVDIAGPVGTPILQLMTVLSHLQGGTLVDTAI